ncbi:Maf family protein, partial [Escherichia coli]|uniref:Maf family protein n=1 Tax=Escherichia coli TaxID=562 RepID=UPI0028557F56
EDEADLRRMLALLSGRRHHCLSAVCLIGADGKARTRISDTIVAFKRLSQAEIDWYVACGEGMGKAGGYAIQGKAEANTAPMPMKNTCIAKPAVRWLSGTRSATSARNGSIAMLIEAVSTHSIRLATQRLAALGIKN